MLSPVASATLIGRADELAVLRETVEKARTSRPQGVVISGEAGIGKTRLLSDFLAALEDGTLVARGQCVDSGLVGTPFTPIRSVLRQLLTDVGADAVREAAGSGASALGALIPGFADGQEPDDSAEQLYEAISAVLSTVSQGRPLVVVIEDLHWADAATLSLLRSLLRTLQAGQVVVVLTYRTDDVGRGHPLRPVLAEMDRSRAIARIDLQRLTESEVAEQVAAITGTRPDPDRMARIVEWSDGVPFFVEELLAIDGAGRGALPDTLRDLVLARYETLSAPTQALLRVLAAGGVSVEHEVLAAVYDRDDESLDAAAAEAVAANVIVTTGTEYAFRHALTQEAVHDQLLPGEHARHHARYAQVLAEHPEAGAAEVAHHLMLAHDLPGAFEATLRAIVLARASKGYASAAQLGERALQLWPRVPDAAEVAGRDHVALLMDTANDLMEVGDYPRCAALLEEAMTELGDDDPRRRIELLDLQATVDLEDPHRQGELAAQALSLIRGLLADAGDDPPAQDLALYAKELGTYAVFLSNECRYPESLEHAEHALAAAVQAGDDAQALRARTYRGNARIMLGDLDEGFEDWAVVERDAAGEPLPLLRLAMFAAPTCSLLGLPRRAVEDCRAGLALARLHNTEGSWGPWLADGLIGALLILGEWDEAVAEAQRSIRLWAHLRYSYPAALALLRVAHVRDDRDRVEKLLDEYETRIRRESAFYPEDELAVPAFFAELALERGDAQRAWDEMTTALDDHLPTPGFDTTALPIAARALAALRRDGGDAPPGTEAHLRELFDETAAWPVADRWRALFDAELGGTAGVGDDPALWKLAVDAVDGEALPMHLRAYARVRLAEALMAHGDRDGTLVALADAHAVAETLGTPLYVRKAHELAARAGLTIEGTDAADERHRTASGVSSLTPRELQVLALVAEGLTNPQIGQQLFISPKTASVHVSAILAKIGAANRAEAAALYTAGMEVTP